MCTCARVYVNRVQCAVWQIYLRFSFSYSLLCFVLWSSLIHSFILVSLTNLLPPQRVQRYSAHIPSENSLSNPRQIPSCWSGHPRISGLTQHLGKTSPFETRTEAFHWGGARLHACTKHCLASPIQNLDNVQIVWCIMSFGIYRGKHSSLPLPLVSRSDSESEK